MSSVSTTASAVQPPRVALVNYVAHTVIMLVVAVLMSWDEVWTTILVLCVSNALGEVITQLAAKVQRGETIKTTTTTKTIEPHVANNV